MKMILPPALQDSEMPTLSELETGLRGPNAAQVSLEASRRLDALELRLRQELSKGVSSKDFSQYSAVLDACGSAREVLQIVVRSTRSAGA